jgi:hypothetical protein
MIVLRFLEKAARIDFGLAAAAATRSEKCSGAGGRSGGHEGVAAMSALPE